MEPKPSNSRLSTRDFFKVLGAGILGGAALGLQIDAIGYDLEFTNNLLTLENLIDKNPQDPSLKEAYSAFVQGHIAIAGGKYEGENLASENLWHYFYGYGKPKNITQEYRQIAENTYGDFENYLGNILSEGLNQRKNRNVNTVASNMEEYITNLGFNLRHEHLPDWSDLEVVVYDDTIFDFDVALGNHTLFAQLAVSDRRQIELGQEQPRLSDTIRSLKEFGQDFQIERFSARLLAPIRLYDKYIFGSQSKPKIPRAGGLNTTEPKLELITTYLKKLPNVKKLPFYMGEQNFNNLLQGNIVITDISLKKLADLKICHSFEVNGSFDKVKPFPIDIIMR
jgi:hypothetical protein